MFEVNVWLDGQLRDTSKWFLLEQARLGIAHNVGTHITTANSIAWSITAPNFEESGAWERVQ